MDDPKREDSVKNRSWTVESSADLLEKAKRELARFRDSHETNDGQQVDHALNCAITLWHIHDWLWQEQRGRLQSEGIDSLMKFRDWLYARDGRDRLMLCERIANGTKHLHLDKPSQVDLTTHVSAMDVPDSVDEAVLKRLHEGEEVVVHSVGPDQVRDVLKITILGC